ncbi:MAG: polysaccharide biosynthesis/export family protein [Hyphomicrobiales bacterium]
MTCARSVIGVFLCLFLGACTGGWPGWNEFYTPAPAGEELGWTPKVHQLSAASDSDGAGAHPSAADVSTYLSGYKVGGGDRLRITVFGQTDLTGEYNIDGLGRISMPLLSFVKIGGLSTPQIERLIEARLRKDFLRNPDVAVEVISFRPFFILGEVRTAGQFPYVGGMTIQKAVAVGGGYTPRADQGQVIVTRQTETGPMTMKLSPTAAVLPGDTIYIRERWF